MGAAQWKVLSVFYGVLGSLHLGLTDTTVYKINNKDLLCITRNYTRYFVIAYKEKESENEYTHTHTHTYN